MGHKEPPTQEREAGDESTLLNTFGPPTLSFLYTYMYGHERPHASPFFPVFFFFLAAPSSFFLHFSRNPRILCTRAIVEEYIPFFYIIVSQKPSTIQSRFLLFVFVLGKTKLFLRYAFLHNAPANQICIPAKLAAQTTNIKRKTNTK